MALLHGKYTLFSVKIFSSKEAKFHQQLLPLQGVSKKSFLNQSHRIPDPTDCGSATNEPRQGNLVTVVHKMQKMTLFLAFYRTDEIRAVVDFIRVPPLARRILPHYLWARLMIRFSQVKN